MDFRVLDSWTVRRAQRRCYRLTYTSTRHDILRHHQCRKPAHEKEAVPIPLRHQCRTRSLRFVGRSTEVRYLTDRQARSDRSHSLVGRCTRYYSSMLFHHGTSQVHSLVNIRKQDGLLSPTNKVT